VAAAGRAEEELFAMAGAESGSGRNAGGRQGYAELAHPAKQISQPNVRSRLPQDRTMVVSKKGGEF
jgi:hypothetical protein